MARPTGFEKWCSTVKTGDIVGATNNRSNFSHLVTVRYKKTAQNSRNGEADPTMIGAIGLCGTRGEGWFWSILSYGDPEIYEEGEDCKRCHDQWRRRGFPKVRNFVREQTKNLVESKENLPFGWAKIAESKESQKTEWNYGKDHIFFEEAATWKRGPRVITIGKVTGQTSGTSYPLLTARRWVEEKEWDTRYRCSTMQQAIKSAYDLMAEGGY